LHTEKDLGCPIETIDPQVYLRDPDAKMEEGDEAIVNWKGYMGDTEREKLRLKREGKSVNSKTMATKKSNDWIGGAVINLKNKNTPTRVLDDPTQFWMKKTTYLANDLHRRAHAHQSLATKRNQEAKELDNKTEEDKRKTKNPEESFKHQPITKHPTKPNLTVVSSHPLLPSSKTWPSAYVLADIPTPAASAAKPKDLSSSFISDVAPKDKIAADQGHNARLMCSVFAGNDDVKDLYQQYDIDVVPLRDEGVDSNFVIAFKDGIAYYQHIGARVVLSTGRGVTEKSRRQVVSRHMNKEEQKEWDMAVAEMDRNMEEKMMAELGGHA